MKKVKIVGKVHAQLNRWGEEKFSYSVFLTDMSAYGHVFIEDVEIEIDEPSVADVVAGTVAALRAQQKKERADAELACTKLDEQIQRLLCIENQS